MTNHLFGRMFQLGYVTRDLDRACARFSDRYGETEFFVMDLRAGDPAYKSPMQRLALCYLDDIMYEIIEIDPAQPSIYDEIVAEDQNALRLHHFGYLIDDYAHTLQRLQSLGYAIPLHGAYGDALDYIYADTRDELGHYAEFIRLGPEGKALYRSLPRNRGQ